MNKVKVAHVLNCVGGVDVYLRLILTNIDNTRFSTIIIHGQSDTKTPFLNKDKTPVKSYTTTIVRNISLINDLRAVYYLYKILKIEKPSIIHVHSAKGGIIGRVAGMILGIKVIYTPHAFSYLSAESKIKKRIFLSIEKLFSMGNCIVLATSKSEKNRAIKEVGYKSENAIVFNNSINAITSVKDLTIKKTWPDEYICTVGRPSYQKNIELMLAVFNEVRKERNIHLVIMGVGHHSSNLEGVKRLIVELNLQDSVTLIDWTDRENIFHIISKSKFYISTSRYEGLPYSVIEALALSKACIVSNCDGNNDLIENGYNGYVIENEKKDEYAQKINLLLSDDLLLEKLSQNALISFNEHYNIKKNIPNLESIYTEFSIK